MTKSSKPSFVYDAITSLIDDIEHIPDPAVRLAGYQYLLEKAHGLIYDARNKAAYEARTAYAVHDLLPVAGCTQVDLYRWAETHRHRNNLERVKRKDRRDMSEAINLRDALGIERGLPEVRR